MDHGRGRSRSPGGPRGRESLLSPLHGRTSTQKASQRSKTPACSLATPDGVAAPQGDLQLLGGLQDDCVVSCAVVLPFCKDHGRGKYFVSDADGKIGVAEWTCLMV